MSAVKDLIKSVRKDFEDKKFDKFIYDVTFPKFKNFAPNVKINFRFPVTVIVGPNGGGKSSVLHAAWGMPEGHSTSRFWFSTAVDPISSVDQNRYWYSHYITALDQVVQCRKISGEKRNGYWEPARPSTRKDHMEEMPPKTPANAKYMSASGDRWNQVVRVPHYINAKAESSAFDRFFYYDKKMSLVAKQDYFAKYSKQLKQVIDNKLLSLKYYGAERISKNVKISVENLKTINAILQKNYLSATYIVHSLYDRNFSPSVIFETSKRNYSETFAGSGELAVVNFVLQLNDVENFDLLLLDEPETSLHPGAQEKLIEHLLQVVKKKKVQVIISSHSATFVEKLPIDALVVLDDSSNGIVVRPITSKSSAFHRLGHVEPDKVTIVTEDRLLKAVIERAVRGLPTGLAKKVVVEAAEVGVSEMLSNQVKAYIQSHSKVLMVLDGDQGVVKEVLSQELDELSAAQKTKLADKLKTDAQVSIVGSAGDFDAWMEWCKARVLIIDQICPEQILLKLLNPTHSLLSDATATNTRYKDAVRKQLNSAGVGVDSSAQYNILKLKMSELDASHEISQNLAKMTQWISDALVALET